MPLRKGDLICLMTTLCSLLKVALTARIAKNQRLCDVKGKGVQNESKQIVYNLYKV